MGASAEEELGYAGIQEGSLSVIFIGESGSGTGKTHLATRSGGLRVPGRTTRALHHARRLANELQEAEGRRELARVVARYARTELVVLDLCRHRDYAEPVTCQLSRSAC